MLEGISLKNFQCHRQLDLHLAQGVNVIAGTSDVGKSAILKAVLWVMTNRPQGLDFRSWDCGKGDVSEVSLTMDGGKVIKRCRSEALNEYWLDAKKFVAMKGEVPSDICRFLDMCPVNIQTQFQPHFLLANSSSEASKILNDACDLSVIDKIIKTTNNMAGQAKADAQAIARQVGDLNERLAGLQWVDDAQERLIAIEAEVGRISDRQKSAQRLCKCLDELEQLSLRAASEQAHILRYKDLSLVADELEQANALQKQQEKLSGLLFSLQQMQQEEDRIVLRPQQDIDKAEQELTTYNRLEKKVIQLANQIDQLDALLPKIERHRRELAEIEMELTDLWQSVDVCPLCGQEVNYGHNHG